MKMRGKREWVFGNDTENRLPRKIGNRATVYERLQGQGLEILKISTIRR